MKKLFLFATLAFFAFTSNAQELNFEETVKYINEKIKCCNYFSDNKNDTITVSKNGVLLKWYNQQQFFQNLFELMNSKSFKPHDDREELLLESNGILLYEFAKANFGVSLLQSREKELHIGQFITKLDAERVYKALIHLRSLCTKEKDPFDN